MAWLNSDDLLAPGTLLKVAEAYRQQSGAVIVGSVVNFSVSICEPLVTIAQENFTWQRFIKFWEGHYAWHQPGIFFPCAAWQAAGALDESFYYCMEPGLFGAGITICLSDLSRCGLGVLSYPWYEQNNVG